MSTSTNALGFLFGGVSCMCAAFVTHPVDTIKVRLQLQGELAKKAVSRTGSFPSLTTTALQSAQSTPSLPKYNGFLRGMAMIFKEEGIVGLYKGFTASLLREASYSTIRMGLYEPFKNALMLDNPTMNLHGPHGAQMPIREPLWAKIVAGGGAGMIGAAIANPTDLIKVRMQAQSEAATHSVMQIVMGIVRSEGLRGLYRGVGPTTQRAIILTASQLPSYDHSKRTLLDSGYFREGIITHFVCSMFAGFVCATTTSPIDLVKSRYMNQKFGSDGVGLKYKTSFDCFKKTLMTEGVAGLFKGWLPQWMRMGPHTIMTFLILEQLRKAAGIAPV